MGFDEKKRKEVLHQHYWGMDSNNNPESGLLLDEIRDNYFIDGDWPSIIIP